VRKLSAAFLFVALVSARAQWRVENVRDEGAKIVHRHVDLADDQTGANAIVDLALFPAKENKLRVIDNASRSRNLAEAMSRSNCSAGVNGGYFDVDFAPLGLRIVDGKTISSLKHGRLMSGVVASNGAVQILRTNEFSSRRKFNSAVQCGPFLVDLGKAVRGLEATREARRTFAAVGGERAAIGVCSDVTLAEAAKILSVSLGDFKIQRALNLDGGSSTAFWFKRADGSAFSISEDKTVRDFLGVVAR
jgi:uncharacterized protein YigE (DUF2233 family)